MPRDKYRPVELTEALRPVAAPVDTFVQAQVPSRDTSLQDLARSLSGLGGSLAGMVGQRDREAEEQDRIRGEAAFHQSTEKGFAEAVAAGAVPAQYSQSFLRGWKNAEGNVAGGILEQKFSAAYDGWAGKSSADPAAFDGFLRGFLKDNIKTNDPDILNGLLPKVRQIGANYLQRHIGDVSKAATQGLLQASAAEDGQALDAANTAGLASRKGTDYEGVFRGIEANREAKLKLGANPQEYDRQVVVDGITAAAIKLRDPKILDFLDRKVPGQDFAWSSTPYGREQRQKTIDTLEGIGRRSIADDERRRRQEKAELKDAVTRDTILAITKDPRAPVPEELLARGEKVDPDFRVNAIRWRDALGKDARTSDPEDLLAVTADILNGGGLQRVQRAMRDGIFRNPEDLTRAYKLAESMTQQGPKLDAITRLQSFRDLTATIKVRTGGKKDLSANFDDGSFSAEGLQAMTDLRRQVLQWAERNPEAGPIEQEEAVAGFGAALLKRLPERDATDTPFYNREGGGGGGAEGAGSPPNVYGAKTATEAGAAGGPAGTVKVPNPMAPDRPAPQGPAYGNRDVVMPSGLPGLPEESAAPPQPQAAPRPTAGPTTAQPSVSPAQPASPAQPPASPAQPPASPAQPSVSQAQPPAAEATTAAAVSAWFESLTPEVRADLEKRAATERKPLMLKAQEIYQRGVAAGRIRPAAPEAVQTAPGRRSMVAPDGTPIETASVAADEPTTTAAEDSFAGDREAVVAAFTRALADRKRRPVGGYVSAQLRDDPQAARILDFVAGPESNGNYNAYFGNAGSKRDLSAMTLDEVMAWSGNRGTKSSATGRYQFMKATLKDLKGQMGLSGAEAFTPALQDRLALQLLERRGYSAWRAGRITDAQFANRLALEWASLPNVTAQNGRPAGVSAYAGDGLNRSLVSPAAVMAALRGGPRGEGGGARQPEASATVTGFFGRLFGRGRKPRGPEADGTTDTATNSSSTAAGRDGAADQTRI